MENEIIQKMLARLENAEMQLTEMEIRMREMEKRMIDLEERVDKMEQVCGQTSGMLTIHNRSDVIVIFSLHQYPFAVAVFGADDWNNVD